MNMSSAPYATETAAIKHSETQNVFEIEAGRLDWKSVQIIERQKGPEIHYEAVVEHPELGRLTWGVWEYPAGVQDMTRTDVGEHEVVRDFDYGIRPLPTTLERLRQLL
jgi:hypothetical protein